MTRMFIDRTISVLFRWTADQEDTEEVRIKKMIMGINALVSIPVNLGYCFTFYTYDEQSAAGVMLFYAILGLVQVFAYVLSLFRNYDFLMQYGIYVWYPMWISTHVLLGGFAQSSMIMVWTLQVPILMPVVYKARLGVIHFLVVILIMIAATVTEPLYYRADNNIPQHVRTVMFAVNMCGVGIYLLLAVYYYVWRNHVLSGQVQSEREKADALLLNIFPRDIAATLKNESRVIADHYDGASVLFADVVNFTPMSATMKPTELVELLNEVFSSFDALVEKHGLEKIKTIGDCYMVAAGVPHHRIDHAHVLTRLALDIRDHARQNVYKGKKLSFRIGINSGPVVAGVIGRKKFIYDLWGDAVNTASRMESHGAEGIVQITEDTYQLIKEEFDCEPRGVINVKGKGQMNVWSVVGSRA